MRVKTTLVVLFALVTSACAASGINRTLPPAGAGADVASAAGRVPAVDMTSLLKLLKKQVVIGSDVDPKNGNQNPYGLAYVAQSPPNGTIKTGDLVICNFNNKANVQGTGTSVVVLNSAPGSKPQSLSASKLTLGCPSLALDQTPMVIATFVTASGAKNETEFDGSGKILMTVKNSLLVEPWGSAFAKPTLPYPPGDGLFVSDASSGKIIRIDLGTGLPKPPVTAVISGFAVNHGKPGSILGPSGMAYVPQPVDTLYIVDGTNNTVVAITPAYQDLQQPNAIVVGANGKTFSGPKAKDAHVVYAGAPLNGPVSSTLLPNGNLIIGNTLDPNGKNILVEITPTGKLLATRNVDTGAAGALFGIASSGASDAATKIYFNDDNANNVQVLQK